MKTDHKNAHTNGLADDQHVMLETCSRQEELIKVLFIHELMRQ